MVRSYFETCSEPLPAVPGFSLHFLANLGAISVAQRNFFLQFYGDFFLLR